MKAELEFGLSVACCGREASPSSCPSLCEQEWQNPQSRVGEKMQLGYIWILLDYLDYFGYIWTIWVIFPPHLGKEACPSENNASPYF